MAGERLIEIMHNVASGSMRQATLTDLVWGTVTSTSPLVVTVEGETSFEIDEDFLIVDPLCVEYKPTLDMEMSLKSSWPNGKETYTAEMLLWKGVEVGERVGLLRLQGGQTFYMMKAGGELSASD